MLVIRSRFKTFHVAVKRRLTCITLEISVDKIYTELNLTHVLRVVLKNV